MIHIWQIGFLASATIYGTVIATEEKGNKLQEAIASLFFSVLWPLVVAVVGWVVCREMWGESS